MGELNHFSDVKKLQKITVKNMLLKTPKNRKLCQFLVFDQIDQGKNSLHILDI